MNTREFISSPIGSTLARSGVLGVILVWALWSNHGLVERLFVIIENNTKALTEIRAICTGGVHAR